MSPHEFIGYRAAFTVAALKLGWTRENRTAEHERDSACFWSEWVWMSPFGTYLISEDDLTMGMAEEIIRIARLVPAATSG